MLKESRKTKTIEILKSNVNMVDFEHIIEFFKTSIEKYRDGECTNLKQVIVTGLHGLYHAHNDEEYFNVGRECDLWVPDSIVPVVIAKIKGYKGAVRTPGADIMEQVFKASEEYGWSHYFYGDTQETLDQLQIKLKERYPKLKIAGVFSPPFGSLQAKEKPEYIAMINSSKADILWVGLGLPKQDLWIYKNREELSIPIGVGVGAAFGFLAETTKRAPKLWLNLNLEWLYMLCQAPKRTWRRVFVYAPAFVIACFREKFGKK